MPQLQLPLLWPPGKVHAKIGETDDPIKDELESIKSLIMIDVYES